MFYFNVHTNMYIIFIYSDTLYYNLRARSPVGDVLNNDGGTAFDGPAVPTNGNVAEIISEIAGAYVGDASITTQYSLTTTTAMERRHKTDGAETPSKQRTTGGKIGNGRHVQVRPSFYFILFLLD